MMYEGAMFWLANTTPSDICEPPLPYFSGENPACVLCVRVCVWLCGVFCQEWLSKNKDSICCQNAFMYYIFFPIWTSPKEMLSVEDASINNPYFPVHLLHAEVWTHCAFSRKLVVMKGRFNRTEDLFKGIFKGEGECYLIHYRDGKVTNYPFWALLHVDSCFLNSVSLR